MSHNKKRIFYLITRAEVAGAQTHVAELLRSFRQQYELMLGTGEEEYLTRFSRNLDIPTIVFQHLTQPVNPVQDILAYFEIKKTLAKFQPDLLHTHSSKAGLIGRLVAGKLGISPIFTAHGWGFTPGPPRSRRMFAAAAEKVVNKSTSHIITVSDFDRNEYLRRNPGNPENVTTIYNAVEDTEHRARPSEENACIRIVMVARFVQQKDHIALLDICNRLKCDYRLVFVGEGPLLDQCKQHADHQGMENKVEFLGSRLDVAEILSSCHIFALATNWEGMPMSIIEAMRAGLPVVVTEVGGVGEAVRDGETGYLVSRGDRDGFRFRLNTLIEDAELRAKMGATGRRRYEKTFQVQRMIDQTANLYSDVLNPNQSSTS